MTRRSGRPEPSFWAYARDFLRDHCPRTRRLSPATTQAYRAGLESFIAYQADANQVERAGMAFECFQPGQVDGYATWLTHARGHAPKTVELRLTAIKAFLKYAAAQDITLMALYEAAAQVKPPRSPKKPVEYMARDATAAILAAHGGTTAKSRRNRTLLILLYDTASRVSEIADAVLGDLSLGAAPHITLTGKGRKTRNMPLMGKTVEHLTVYLEEFHPGKDPAAPLFYSLKHGRPAALSTDAVTLILKQAAEQARHTGADVPERVYCHLIRKTRAMHLFEDGVPLPLIMQMLGHEQMSTTSAFYAFATNDMMAKAIQAATPSALQEPPTWKEQATIDALYAL